MRAIRLVVTDAVLAALKRLADTGLYGAGTDETATVLLLEKLREVLAKEEK